MNYFNVGDRIICTQKHSLGVERFIINVRLTGYSWVYPDMPNKGMCDTENSTDPMLECGWEIKKRLPKTKLEITA